VYKRIESSEEECIDYSQAFVVLIVGGLKSEQISGGEIASESI